MVYRQHCAQNIFHGRFLDIVQFILQWVFVGIIKNVAIVTLTYSSYLRPQQTHLLDELKQGHLLVPLAVAATKGNMKRRNIRNVNTAHVLMSEGIPPKEILKIYTAAES